MDTTGVDVLLQQSVNSSTESSTLVVSNEEASTTPDIPTYIAQHLGAQHLPLTTIVPISVVYAIIFVLGVLGNVSTICVILKNKYMHTPTNVYLANLAISDLLTHLVAMPFELYLLWRQYPWVFGEVICDAKMITTETVTYSSILTIVAFTVERYLAICRPLAMPRRHSKMTRAVWALLAIWVASVTFSLPWLFYNKVNYLTNKYTNQVLEESAWCAVPWNENARTPLYLMITSTVVAFIIPFTLVTVLYYRIGLAMKKSSALKRCAAHGSGMECEAEITYNKGRQAVVRMLGAVVLVFFVCWTPFHAQRLMFVIVTLQGRWTRTNGRAHHILFLASGVGYYLSSCVNPLLYSVMSKRFRRGFADMFKRHGHGHGAASNVCAAAAAAAAVNGDTKPMNSTKGSNGREVTRFQLQMAPRHVITSQCKEDILKKAFRSEEFDVAGTIHLERMGISGSSSHSLITIAGGTGAGGTTTTLGPPLGNLNKHSSTSKTSSDQGIEMVSSTKCGSCNANGFNPFCSVLCRSPKLVVRWKRPNESDIHTGYLPPIDRSMVQIKITGGNGDCDHQSRKAAAADNIGQEEFLGPKKSRRLRFLRVKQRKSHHHSSSKNDRFQCDQYDDSLSTTRNNKSEGDTPECFSEEVAEMIADSVRTDMMTRQVWRRLNVNTVLSTQASLSSHS